MDRRVFLGSLAGVLATPLSAAAQQGARVPLVGILDNGVPRLFTVFREGLRELGYVEDQNIRLAVKSAHGRPDLIQGLAAELVALRPDVIVTIGIAVRAVRRASPTIPIVVAATRDAVASGFTSSLARPADNITGQSFLNTELSAKRLALLKDTLPRARRIAMLVHADSGPDRDVTETRTAAQRLGLHVQRVDVRLEDLARSFSDAKRERADAVDVLASAWFNAHRERIVELAAQSRLPAIYESRDYVDAGGLMSYGQNLAVLFRRAATYVDKILKGAKPDDLPWEQPAQFELIINMKTAKALGLTIPQSVLQRADQVIDEPTDGPRRADWRPPRRAARRRGATGGERTYRGRADPRDGFEPARPAEQRGFERGLQEHGWVPGQSIRIEYRYADGKPGRVPQGRSRSSWQARAWIQCVSDSCRIWRSRAGT